MDQDQTLQIVLSSLEQTTITMKVAHEKIAQLERDKTSLIVKIEEQSERIIELEKGISHEQEYSQRLEDHSVGALERDL